MVYNVRVAMVYNVRVPNGDKVESNAPFGSANLSQMRLAPPDQQMMANIHKFQSKINLHLLLQHLPLRLV